MLAFARGALEQGVVFYPYAKANPPEFQPRAGFAFADLKTMRRTAADDLKWRGKREDAMAGGSRLDEAERLHRGAIQLPRVTCILFARPLRRRRRQQNLQITQMNIPARRQREFAQHLLGGGWMNASR